jgi:hypothetical protein
LLCALATERSAVEIIRGELAKQARIIAPHACIRWIHEILTMMQQCASARVPGRRAQSSKRPSSHAGLRVTATSDHHRQSTILRSPASETLCLLAFMLRLHASRLRPASRQSSPYATAR